MYTLRTFNSEGVESNIYLGKNYEVIKRNSSDETFRKQYKKAFGKDHVADLDSESNSASKDCNGFIYDENGRLHYLSKSKPTYIVSSDGKTFANLTERS